MKIQFASIAKGLRRRALVFAIVLVAVPTVWLTISFSQDSGTVSAPTNAPYDATIGAQQMTTERTFGGIRSRRMRTRTG